MSKTPGVHWDGTSDAELMARATAKGACADLFTADDFSVHNAARATACPWPPSP